MITRLLLENWRSHENTELEFGRGTNVLVGAMGSGKSSAMDAISFALFGTFPNLNQRKVRLDDMIMNKPERKGHAKVVMGFSVDGKEYVVKREITRGRGQTSAEIRMGDKLIEAANQRVNDRVKDILKMDFELFSRAVYAEQNNIDYFLEIPKGRRREKIDELLNIDRFEAARKNLGIVITRMVDRMNDRNSFISGQQDTSEMGELEKNLSAACSDLEKKELGLLEKRKKKGEAELGYSNMLKKKASFSEFDNRIKENNGRIKAIEEKLREYGRIEADQERVKEALKKKVGEKKQAKGMAELRVRKEAELENYKNNLEAAERDIADIEKQLEKMKYDKSAPEKLRECRRKHHGADKALEETKSSYKSACNRLTEIGESMKKLGEGLERCPTCDSELDEKSVTKVLEKRKHEKKELEEKKENFAEKIEELSSWKEKLDKEIEELQEAVANLEAGERLTQNKEKRLKDRAKIKQDSDILLEQLASLRVERGEEEIDKEIRGLEKTLEYFSYKEELDKTGKELERVKAELAKLGYKEEDERKAYDGLKELEKQTELLAEQCKNLSELIAEKKKRLEDLRRIRDEVEKGKKEIEYLNRTIDSFEILQKVLQDVQGRLREEFTEETNAALTDVWKRLYPYADYLNLMLAVDDAGDYILQLQRRDGTWINVEGTTSGGERSTACLALRIALSLVLTQNLSWLVLDEPTHNLDRRAIRELSVTLREHLPKIVDQVFVITHEEELESAASGYLYRLERNKEEDEPTKIVTESAV